jgi:predicted aminopeptidase
VTSQALHQNDLFNRREPVELALARPGLPEKAKAGLLASRRILDFARAEGLNADGAYRYFIQTSEPVVSYLVQAAEPDRLKFVTWWFPVVGRVPYLGFFAKADRDAKAAELKAAAYDVHEGGAGAFSSLGWFEDPLFTSMVGRGEAELAHLLFHELTHRTFWAPGSVEFNENLAEYVAWLVTTRYLEHHDLGALKARYDGRLADRVVFKAWLKGLKADLTALYANPEKRPRSEILAMKAQTFARHLAPPLRPKFAVVDYIGDEEWNNAAVLAAGLYAPDLDRFARAHRCLGQKGARAFLDALRDRAAARDGEDLFVVLDGFCRKG